MITISSAQLRAARGLLNWSRDDLAKAAAVTARTVARIELGETRSRPTTLAAINRAIERAGIVFILENGGGAGVRFARRSKRR